MKLYGIITPENQYYFLAAAGAVLVLFLAVLFVKAFRPLPKKIEAKIKRKEYIRIEDFLDSWKKDKRDYPGCYVMLIYDKKLIFNPMNYDDIYVGQSVNVRKRVFSHVMGHGNGNVYYGLKSGCKVYVIIQKCSKRKLNQAEVELIRYFKATTSLNMTRGGAPVRK